MGQKLPTRNELANPIMADEVKETVRKLKARKAPGGDGIVTELIKNGGPMLCKAITQLFNLCHTDMTTSHEWNEEIMKMLYKAGENTDLNNYRGISLTNVIGKIFASILARRMNISDAEMPWLPQNQAAYRVGHSIEDNQFILVSLIDQAKATSIRLIIAFIDITKPYDNVRRPILWQVLKAKGFQEKYISLLQSMYSQTTKRVSWRNHETEKF